MEQYAFVKRDTGSSVYTAVAKYLLEERKHDWRKVSRNSGSFNLMFGERNKLPFGRLGKFTLCLYMTNKGSLLKIIQNLVQLTKKRIYMIIKHANEVYQGL